MPGKQKQKPLLPKAQHEDKITHTHTPIATSKQANSQTPKIKKRQRQWGGCGVDLEEQQQQQQLLLVGIAHTYFLLHNLSPEAKMGQCVISLVYR